MTHGTSPQWHLIMDGGIFGSNGLGTIFNDHQAILICYFQNTIHVSALTVEMYRYDGPDAHTGFPMYKSSYARFEPTFCLYECFYGHGINIVRLRVDIYEEGS